MGNHMKLLSGLKDNRGASAIIVGMMMLMFIGFAALAIDIGHLYVVRNEIQNAADAGSLAGALVLYDEDGNVNPGANAAAETAAEANLSEGESVEVNFSGNDGDVQRGIWVFDPPAFTPYDSLDSDAGINAVRVITHNPTAASFFSGIFGFEYFALNADAVAYRGHAGPDVEYNQPIAVCRKSIVDENGDFLCTRGRMIPNGGDSAINETARWTNFSMGPDPDTCGDSANMPSIRDWNGGPQDFCPGPDDPKLSLPSLGKISTNNGEIEPIMNRVRDCWESTTNRTVPWSIILPVIECERPPTCSEVVGAVQVEVLWITETGEDPNYDNIPVEMYHPELGDWSQASNCSGFNLTIPAGREACWNSFVDFFDIKYLDENGAEQSAIYIHKTLYFRPSCEEVEAGGPGGEDFNVHSEYPKLVE